MPRLVASLSALLIACGCFIVGGAPLLRDDGAAVLPSSVQVHALPREGSPLAPPDGAVAAYLAPEGGCLVTLTLVGGGGGGGTLTSECVPPSCAADAPRELPTTPFFFAHTLPSRRSACDGDDCNFLGGRRSGGHRRR
jgi:hypothetical protein